VNKGDLYILAERGNHHKVMFPYFDGGQVLIVSVKTENMIIPLKRSVRIKVVEFLYNGRVYLESTDSFLLYANKIGDTNV